MRKYYLVIIYELQAKHVEKAIMVAVKCHDTSSCILLNSMCFLTHKQQGTKLCEYVIQPCFKVIDKDEKFIAIC